MPKIIEVLGCMPFECPESPLGKLRYFKRVNGLSYEKLGKVMGRDPEQLMDWVSGRVKPCEKIFKVLLFSIRSYTKRSSLHILC
ncbi:MAG: hypothetical protein ACOYU0_09910 [Nitrospirota bacterium]